MKKSFKNKRGITLIALVITIIVLLIIAAVTIAQLQNNGLLSKSEDAKNEIKQGENTEVSRLNEYEEMIRLLEVGGARNQNVLEDIDISFTLDISEKIGVNVAINANFEDIVYVVTINGRIFDFSREKNYTISDLDPETEYIISAYGIEGNGNIHKVSKKYKTRKANFDVFGSMKDSGETINDCITNYGMTITRSGKNQVQYHDFYKLGMASDSGINTNTYKLTIDYNTLTSKIGSSDFIGICGQFYENASTSNGYTSWVYSKIIVTYTDDTTTEKETEKMSVRNTSTTLQPYIALKFDEGKTVSKLELIIYEYDSNYGGAAGFIENIELIP